ncbi:MAG TPA: phosphotransferase family protein [Burkholderiales bacterium]|nr:phosphotransferase family protein [Burkholderiales bacterium]
MTNDDDKRARLAAFVRDASGARDVSITTLERMSGGAVQENWALDAQVTGGEHAGAHRWVLRMDAPARVAESLDRADEFRVLQAMQAAAVRAPRPLWVCEDRAIMGSPFFIMARLPGVAAGHKVARDPLLVPDRARLARELAANLTRIHSVAPPHPALGFLATSLALDNVAHYRAYLDTLAESHPVLEWGLRWCERHAPEREETTFIHRDYRTGNYLVDEGSLAGVLDWEFAAYGNPLEDIGWLFAKCWRFGQHRYEAGGVADGEDFLREYVSLSGRSVDAFALRYWQVMAHLRWAVIALQQRERHRSGVEPSLELALTGHLLSDLELEILALAEGNAAERTTPLEARA